MLSWQPEKNQSAPNSLQHAIHNSSRGERLGEAATKEDRMRSAIEYFVFTLLLLSLLLPGCARRPVDRDILDVRTLPQSASFYLDPASADRQQLAAQEQNERSERFRQKFFSPWRQDGPRQDRKSLFWMIAWLDKAKVYGANLRQHSPEWVERLIAAADQAGYPSLDQPAIILRATDLRVLPSAEPCFLDPARAGEGFPFDYLQNSRLEAGTPVRITHRTGDGAWLLAESALVSGWVKASAVAQVDEDFIGAYQRNPLLAVLQEQLPVSDSEGRFRFYARIGSLLPLTAERDEGFTVLVPAADEQGQAVLKTALISRAAAAPFPVAATARSIASLADRLLGQSYGWGGSFGKRDCSATMRDLFTPFGLWLPRNSAQQAKTGQVFSFAGLSLEEKKQLLSEQGVPYLTLVWMRGHIMLYLGEQRGEGLVLQSVWGLKTEDLRRGAGRKLIGKTVITSLQPGRELHNLAEPEGNLLYRADGFTLL